MDVRSGPFDERIVVERVLDGDGEAYGVLVAREAAAVVRTCERILGDRAAAQEVAQEAFVIAYRHLGTWRGEGTFGAWLDRIAVRIAMRTLARRRTVTWIGYRVIEGQGQSGGGPGKDGRDPMTIGHDAERSASLRAAVARLEEPYRETVAMRFFGERSLEEIAELTGRPVRTVKRHLHRGLQRLRVLVDEVER